MVRVLSEAVAQVDELSAVRTLLIEAIERLDRISAPAEIAAHVDLALHCLTAEIEA